MPKGSYNTKGDTCIVICSMHVGCLPYFTSFENFKELDIFPSHDEFLGVETKSIRSRVSITLRVKQGICVGNTIPYCSIVEL